MNRCSIFLVCTVYLSMERVLHARQRPLPAVMEKCSTRDDMLALSDDLQDLRLRDFSNPPRNHKLVFGRGVVIFENFQLKRKKIVESVRCVSTEKPWRRVVSINWKLDKEGKMVTGSAFQLRKKEIPS